MAIYRAVPPPEALATNAASTAQLPPSPVASGAVDIDAWTLSALQSLSVSPVARGTGTPLAIPIDEHTAVAARRDTRTVAFHASATPETPRRPPSRRDSQRRREEILRGHEGSRQRRRWENDRLVGVPNVQPPLATDWEVHPTHRVHPVPYQLAQFWDRGARQRAEDKAAQLQAARKKQQRTAGSATGLGAGEVPRDLRETAKRSPAVRGWVRALEEPVRRFLAAEQDRRRQQDDDSAAEAVDSEDDEIVFVGRGAAMSELWEKREARYKMARREVEHETVDSGVVFDSFGEGEGAAYKRWLTHAISDYYGLASRSVTLAHTPCRVVYVGLKQAHQRTGPPLTKLPCPLWELC
ncbi:hypothetical protein TOPH_02456 [Tolypocladium ophioglossoides CBS 100239]|uniref:R3H-associated N-terminal domain-containing protein n=1 Tax=Tolypocladium ophioglossoides (strain CBS 100239) TaxID=1163406 RepID=A0A0L0NGN3_TOLOC|nr:hypothetical protein TOPH_02456 [Tolypocladium ophioglossoides CBS 100239]